VRAANARSLTSRSGTRAYVDKRLSQGQRAGGVRADPVQRDQGRRGGCDDAAQTLDDQVQALVEKQHPLSEVAQRQPGDGGDAVVLVRDAERGAGGQELLSRQRLQTGAKLGRCGAVRCGAVR
jgi:hypothetical protein